MSSESKAISEVASEAKTASGEIDGPTKMSSIEQIVSITPISFLKDYECAQILGYSIAAPKGKFKKDDLVIYHAAGSILKLTEEVELMKLKGGRVYTRSINGFVSEGLIMPIVSMKTYTPDVPLDSYQVGQDVTVTMGTTRQQIVGEDVEAGLKVANLGDGRLPYGVPKTKQERGERCNKVLKEMDTRDIVISVKQDGRSDTRCYYKGEYYFAGRTQVVFDTLEIKKQSGLPIPDWATSPAPIESPPLESSTSSVSIESSTSSASASTSSSTVAISISTPLVVLPAEPMVKSADSVDLVDSAKSTAPAKQESNRFSKLKKFKPQDMLGAPITPHTSASSAPSVSNAPSESNGSSESSEVKAAKVKVAKPPKAPTEKVEKAPKATKVVRAQDPAWLEKIAKLKAEGQARKALGEKKTKSAKVVENLQSKGVLKKITELGNLSTSLSAEQATTPPGERYLVDLEKKYHFQKVLTVIDRNVALQGELVGPKINHNRMQLDEYEWYLFDVYDIDNHCYLGQDQVDYFAEKLGCPTTPIVYRGKFVKELFGDIQLLRELARAQRWPILKPDSARLTKPAKPSSKPSSKVAKSSKSSKTSANTTEISEPEVIHLADERGIFAEGIVLKTDDSTRSGAKRHSMKIHNTNYLRIYELDGYSE